MKLQNFFDFCLDIIFPRFCVGCSTVGTYLCYRCYETIEYSVFPITIDSNSLDSVSCCTLYDGIPKKLIAELKYRSIKNISKTIADLIYHSMNIHTCQYVTYVPIHWRKRNLRGFNQAKLIAQHLTENSNLQILSTLKKINNTKSQMSQKSKKDREENLSGSFKYELREPLQNKDSILLLDDVYTTGTTLKTCAKILKQNGWEKVHGICFAQRN